VTDPSVAQEGGPFWAPLLRPSCTVSSLMAEVTDIRSKRVLIMLVVMVVLGLGLPTLAAYVFGSPPPRGVPSRVTVEATPAP
jgi:hypothetical protein